MTNDQIALLTFDYVSYLAQKKIYNAQMVANAKYCKSIGRTNAISILQKPVNEFCDLYTSGKVKDFIFKNDSFTPRNMYLLNPAYYLYYTYIVFKASYLFSQSEVNFSLDKISVFYSGNLDFKISQDNIKDRVSFNYSYSLFQQKRKEYFGNPVLSTDIQNFFDNIHVNSLIEVLRELLGEHEVIDELDYFLKHCQFDSVPQLHYSIASSILSQFFLHKFDNAIHKTLIDNELLMVRFVDDMYIIYMRGSATIRENNEVLNVISSVLWKQGLSLNISKTKLLSSDEYVNGFDVSLSEYEDASYSSEKIIDEKAIEVIANGDFLEFISKITDLENANGVDLQKYYILLNQYLAIENDDANKVLKNIIYSRKWLDIDKKQLKNLVNNWRYILFNPSEFTVLFLMVYSDLERKKMTNRNENKIKALLNYLLKKHTHTLRDSLVAVTYLFQRSFVHQDLIRKVYEVNPDFVKFYIKYIV